MGEASRRQAAVEVADAENTAWDWDWERAHAEAALIEHAEAMTCRHCYSPMGPGPRFVVRGGPFHVGCWPEETRGFYRRWVQSRRFMARFACETRGSSNLRGRSVIYRAAGYLPP